MNNASFFSAAIPFERWQVSSSRRAPLYAIRVIKMAATTSGVKHALVTGASSGIGKALTKLLAEQGMHVLAVARRGELLAEIASPHPQLITAVAADLATSEGRAAVLKAVVDGSATLDYLVHNAGGESAFTPPQGSAARDSVLAQCLGQRGCRCRG